MKYNISEFTKDVNLVIKCNTLQEVKKVGEHLWFFISMDNWKPYDSDFPWICWYSSSSTNFNPLKSKYDYQTPVDFKDVIFEEQEIEIEDGNSLLPIFEQLNIR